MSDPINSPAHYRRGGLESIEVIEYVLRALAREIERESERASKPAEPVDTRLRDRLAGGA